MTEWQINDYWFLFLRKVYFNPYNMKTFFRKLSLELLKTRNDLNHIMIFLKKWPYLWRRSLFPLHPANWISSPLSLIICSKTAEFCLGSRTRRARLISCPSDLVWCSWCPFKAGLFVTTVGVWSSWELVTPTSVMESFHNTSSTHSSHMFTGMVLLKVHFTALHSHLVLL